MYFRYWVAAIVGFLLILNGLFGKHLTTRTMGNRPPVENPPSRVGRALYILLCVEICLYGVFHLIR